MLFQWNHLWRHYFAHLRNTKTWISPTRKSIFQRGNRSSSLLWKAFQISSNYIVLPEAYHLLGDIKRKWGDMLLVLLHRHLNNSKEHPSHKYKNTNTTDEPPKTTKSISLDHWRPSIINSGDGNWNFKHEVDLSSFRLQNCLFLYHARMSFRHMTSFCILNETVPATGTIHKNQKIKAIKLCDFKTDLIKWQLNWVECNLIWNHTRAARSFDFEITRMISHQIALHSVQ